METNRAYIVGSWTSSFRRRNCWVMDESLGRLRGLSGVSSGDAKVHTTRERERLQRRSSSSHGCLVSFPGKFDGAMESLGHVFHAVNDRVLRYTPCSVGILIDRGLGGTTQVSASDVSYTVFVPYFCGRDDGEALAYGMRMAEHPGILLNVIKFVAPPRSSVAPGTSTNRTTERTSVDEEDDRQLLNDFVASCEGDQSRSYDERVVEKHKMLTQW